MENGNFFHYFKITFLHAILHKAMFIFLIFKKTIFFTNPDIFLWEKFQPYKGDFLGSKNVSVLGITKNIQNCIF